jgi:hypothetical protein
VPILVASHAVVSAAQDSSNLVTSTFTASPGEVIVVVGITENSTDSLNTPTGGGLTYTAQVSNTVASHCACFVWTAVATGATSAMAVTVGTGATTWHSMVVTRWSNARLASSPAVLNTTGTGSPNVTLTTAASASVIAWGLGDWSATAGARTYRSSAIEVGNHDKSAAGSYVADYAYQLCGAPGSQTVGITAPTPGGNWTTVGVEVQHQSRPVIAGAGVAMAQSTDW